MFRLDRSHGLLPASVASLVLFTILGCQSGNQPTAGPAPMQPAGPGPLSNGHDTPILVGGGATTFYLNQKEGGKYKDWNPPLTGSAKQTLASVNQYCATVKDASQAVLEHFDQSSPVMLFSGQSTWSIKLWTLNNTMTLSAANDLCGTGTGPGVQVSVDNPGKGTGFYPTELPNVARHHRRFKDIRGACANDEDSCERIVKLTYNNTDYDCSNLNCSLFIGLPQSVATSGKATH
ncbi:MAG TPA: hypothetical protein VKV02_01945 [Acidobacteriaceae bacterium]|nr:hypothetical protein [Acidobacteriaceae bacterium]